MAAKFDRGNYRVALSNLEAAFGNALTPARREEIARESYQHFARTVVDLFWSPSLTKENYSRYIDVENLDVVQEAMREGNRNHLCLLPLQQL